MKEVIFDLGHINFPVHIPDHAEIFRMGKASLLSQPEEKIYSALQNPIDSLPLKRIVKQKLAANPEAKAVVVISDNTRPVPYSGESGILFPIVDEMIKAGLKLSQIRLLVATGTHRPMSPDELKDMLDPRINSLRLQTINHVCWNSKDLVCIGQTDLGGEIFLNRYYIESEIKILTGLVESHFMAGVSGGRKSICPGLLAENSTHILHGGPILSSPKARDLILEGNPVHEESLRIAKMVGCDMIVNVTLDSSYRLTGIFAGDLEKAHLEAVNKLKSYAAIPLQKKYDIILTNVGFVGVNHYQAAKGATICAPALKKNGFCILAAHHTDKDPIGGAKYKKMMRVLGEVGPEKFLNMIMNPAWHFIPEQWEAQMWTRLFRVIPPENLIYCTFEIPKDSFSWLPETDARILVPEATTLEELVEKSLHRAIQEHRHGTGQDPDILILPDGPYGIPLYLNQNR